MVVSETRIGWDFERWRRTLATYKIDGRPVLDLSRGDDRALLDGLMSHQNDVASGTEKAPIEPCVSILARTTDKQPITDDNMGTEWRYPLGFE